MPPTRTQARRRALECLFAAEFRGDSALEVLTRDPGEQPVDPYTEGLVRGVSEHQDRVDRLLASYAQDWSLDRMPAIDRTALRIGAFEMLCRPDVPDEVAVSEAVGLVRQLSTDDSPGFVNGILGAILRDRADGVLVEPPPDPPDHAAFEAETTSDTEATGPPEPAASDPDDR